MRGLSRILLIGVVCTHLASLTLYAENSNIPATPGPRGESRLKGQVLEKSAIRALYIDGEFDKAVEMLEGARREGRLMTHGDSVFAFKHLGVMYAAKYETQELGKRYMYLLLTIEPTVRIMDMYASDMIYMIFKNVKSEYEMRHTRPGLDDSVENISKAPAPDNVSTKSSHKTSDRGAWPYWAAGGAFLAAGLGLTAYLLWDEGDTSPTRYEGGY